MCSTTDGRVTGLVSELKWEKTKKLVLELKEMLDVSLATEDGKTISRQRLLEIPIPALAGGVYPDCLGIGPNSS